MMKINTFRARWESKSAFVARRITGNRDLDRPGSMETPSTTDEGNENNQIFD
jgi:hypothetical protein